VGAHEQPFAREESNEGLITVPGGATWFYGFALLPLLFGFVPWLLATSAQHDHGSTAEAFAVDGDPITQLVPAVPGAGALFAVGGEGLYRGDAAGVKWELVGEVPPAGEIVASADGAEILLAGSTPSCGRGDGGTPLSRSTDGGATWNEVSDVADIRPLAIWGEDELALGADCAGLQVSTDNGDSWVPVDGLESGREITAFAVVVGDEGRRVLVGSTGEGGTSQLFEIDMSDPAAPEVSEPLKEYFGLGAVAGIDEQRFLAGPEGVWVSDNRGDEWTLSASGLEDVVLSVDPLLEPIPEEEMERGFGLRSMATDPANTDQIALGSVDGVYLSDDGGEAWTGLDGIEGEIERIVISETGGLVFVQAEDEVFSAAPWEG
jgi:hypothetical protein